MAKGKQSESTRKVSKSLQETVAANPHIDLVHFDTQGNHHFQVHEHKAEGKGADGSNDGLYARIQVTNLIDNKKNISKVVKTPIVSLKIVETLDRDQILNAEPESDLLNMSLAGLTEAERKVIAKMRKGD